MASLVGVESTVGEWAAKTVLVLQMIVAGSLLAILNVAELIGGVQDTVPIWQLALFQLWLALATFAPIGIFRRRAWGYFLEIPALGCPMALLFVGLLHRMVHLRSMPQLDFVLPWIFLFGEVQFLWRLAQSGLELRRESIGPKPAGPLALG
jgi:hypothetical protein